MSNDPNKKVSPNKKYWAETNGALLNIASREKKNERYSLALNKYALGKPIIFRWSADSKAVGMFIAKAIPYDAGGYTLSRNNYWIGIWYPFRNEFFTVHIQYQSEIFFEGYELDSIEVLADERAVICSAKGKEFKRVEMPKEPMISDWLKEKRDLEKTEPKPPDLNKKEWTWNENQYGYEGVHLYEGQVLWFQHSHNPHAGGAACSQSFEDFLENGPSCSIPTEYFKEFYDVVNFLAGQKNS